MSLIIRESSDNLSPFLSEGENKTMPKPLFFAIEANKRERIIIASQKEFSSHLYYEASINQIIQEAGISRGSFYKYFEDKDDLYFYIIKQVIDSTAHAFIKDFTKTQSVDCFSVFKVLFLFNLELISNGNYHTFFENMYLSMNYKIQQRLKGIFNEIRDELLDQTMIDILNHSGLERKHFIELMNIVELIHRDLLVMKIANHLDDQSILEIYDTRMYLLRNNYVPN